VKELANDKTTDLSEMTGTQDDQPVAWRPSLEYVEHSRLKRFMEQHRIRDYAQLPTRSTEARDWF